MDNNENKIILPLHERLRVVTDQITADLEEKQKKEGGTDIYGFKIGLAREIGNLQVNDEETLKIGLKQAIEKSLDIQVSSFDGVMPDAKPLAATFLITDIAKKMGIELE
ncbi:hypothetical protein A3B57_02965 [Microgenomates group bacterium RIFCSPLOWO2_01_FULL_47_10]|nr:MAG: hypothetical protein A3B57_02965 [Microgenomates group bacterium RIFCSPLOWO2_01_FULL_47_10]